MNSHNISILQFCKLINQLLIDFNKVPLTREEYLSIFNDAYDNWIYQESIFDYAEKIIKPYLKALNNLVDEQILKSIVDSILQNVNLDDLNDEFMQLLMPKVKSRLDSEDLYLLSFTPIQSSYFAILIRKYKIDEFTDTINYIINSLIGNINKADRPMNPNEFQNLTDKEDPIEHTVVSTIEPISFNKYRTTGVVVLDDLVLLGNKDHTDIINDRREYCQKNKVKNYNPEGENILDEFGITTLAVGSAFGKAVLLEYVTSDIKDKIDGENISSNNGNLELVKRALKKKGYQKVYLQKGSPYVSKRYVRKAKRSR